MQQNTLSSFWLTDHQQQISDKILLTTNNLSVWFNFQISPHTHESAVADNFIQLTSEETAESLANATAKVFEFIAEVLDTIDSLSNTISDCLSNIDNTISNFLADVHNSISNTFTNVNDSVSKVHNTYRTSEFSIHSSDSAPLHRNSIITLCYICPLAVRE